MASKTAPGALAFEDVANRARPWIWRRSTRVAAEDLQFDDPANIQFTSGTTGSPKGVTLSHHNILNNGYFTGRAMRLTPEDRICIPVPLYHCFGMVMGNLAAATLGAAMVYPGEGFDPLATLQTVPAGALHRALRRADDVHRRTRSSRVRPLRSFVATHRHHGRRALSDRGDAQGGRAHAHARRHHRLWHDRDQPCEFPKLDWRTRWSAASTTIGRVHPHVEVKVVDGKKAASVPRGVRGELCTRGYSVMSGYWGEEEKTREAKDAAAWMHTGDLAVIDAEGYGNIVGRIKDMVIRGGENLYPREIEEYLFRHPKVQDVQVFGVADERYGEELCAWIRVRGGEALTAEEVRGFCQGQIAHNKIPRYVEFVDEFPMTVTGKAQKFLMRAAVEERMGLRRAETA